MKKTSNVKATKLMVDDTLKVGGTKYRITYLNRSFGRGHDRVRIHAHSKGRRRSIDISVSAKTTFTIFNK